MRAKSYESKEKRECHYHDYGDFIYRYDPLVKYAFRPIEMFVLELIREYGLKYVENDIYTWTYTQSGPYVCVPSFFSPIKVTQNPNTLHGNTQYSIGDMYHENISLSFQQLYLHFNVQCTIKCTLFVTTLW